MFATIDIGTHSVLLLIGDVLDDGTVRLVEDRIFITRLGEGVAHGSLISQDASDRTIHALGLFLKLCNNYKVREINAIGTAALRNARNTCDFLNRADKELGLVIDVISAEKEARLTYEASAHDFGKEILVIDIGGGSTELICGPPPLSLVSIPIGCVSLSEEFVRGNPVSDEDEKSLRNGIFDMLDGHVSIDSSTVRTFVATAGTATTLMAMHYELEPYDGRIVHGQNLDSAAISSLVDSIRIKTIDELKAMPGLMPDRAEVIFAGAVLLQEIMNFLGCSEVTISDRGVRWGAFYEEFVNP